jgi:hypothetical protein
MRRLFIMLGAVALITLGFGCSSSDTSSPVSAGVKTSVPISGNTTTTPGTPKTSIATPTTSADGIFSSGRKLTDDTLSLAKANKDSAYSKVESRGGEFVSLDEGKNYGVWWQPEGFDPKTDVVVVSLGGHAGWATKDFDVWYPHISTRGYGFFTLQWWLGRSLENDGYYEPEEMYAMIAQALQEKGITPGNVIFQGYSMGSARSYGITALDLAGSHYFGLTIANSGVWEDGYPLNADILSGKYGAKPFTGTHWILYCAINDEEHKDWNKCEKMDKTQTKLEGFGGSVELYIKDSIGSHGSFMVNAANVTQALDVADTFVTGQ